MTLCEIWHHLYNLKYVKNTHGRVLFLEYSCRLKRTTFTKKILRGIFSRFLNCTNGAKSRKALHIVFFVNFVTKFYILTFCKLCKSVLHIVIFVNFAKALYIFCEFKIVLALIFLIKKPVALFSVALKLYELFRKLCAVCYILSCRFWTLYITKNNKYIDI